VPSTTSIEISRPPEQVFAYVTDPSRFVEWQDGVVSGHLADDGPVAVGHRCITTRRIGFAERAVTSEITRLDPPRAWGVHGIDGPIRAVVDVTVEARDGGRSEVTIGLDFTGHGIGKLLVPLVVRPAAGREMHANLQRLKERIEAG
jgi:uncharacterized protein YndB with AHSA1/START domain